MAQRSVKLSYNHGNPGCIQRWWSDKEVDIPNTCSPVSPDQKGRMQKQSKPSHHKASSRAAACIFHVK